jgi:hypothetical protein
VAEDTKARTAGYAPAVNVVAVINKLRCGATSGPVDRGLLVRIGIKESLAKRVFNTLKTLGLIDDDGTLRDEFKTLINARPDEYRTALAAFLREAYRDIFSVVDPATATPEALRNAFWGYEPRGQIDSMIRLFLGLCEEAGLVEATPERAARTTQRRPSASSSNMPPQRTAEVPAPPMDPPMQDPPSAVDGAREKYLELLLAKVAEQETPDTDLLDRIERALGIAPKQGASP